ncbi:hypothetical protein LWI29_015381 [Acer saccharum]|uniref:Ubiquitin-like domain-containing protein n=1 Tax=Acer saccharum TaxID=4024 RepID=A0AA39W6F2_ACESA|nr:hypothetical protein LWI29_015381 [Acer saccharum]
MATVQFRISGGQVTPEITMPISATILDLKERIQLFTDICMTRQTLRFNNQELTNDRTISHYEFGQFATLVLGVKPLDDRYPKFFILVKSCNEQSKLIRVKETTLVGDLRSKIERHFGIPGKLLSLFRLSQEMKDEFPISAYYVCAGSQVEVVINIEPR